MKSIWRETCEIEERKPLDENIETEVAVIGAGMTGILAAYYLQREGKDVVVLEAKKIGSGQTQNTTAKVTSQHGLIYHALLKQYGKEKAQQYALANETAIREYQNIITDLQIDCDFEYKNSYIYSKSRKELEAEAKAACLLGLPAALAKEELPLPFPVWGAVEFQNQAQFHPLKFLKAISEKVKVYENTEVERVEGNKLITKQGSVQAEKIIFACHFPFVNFPGMYFARIHQERSYVLALKDASQVNGMYMGAEKGDYSFRNYGEYLLLGGMGHRTGKNAGSYEALRKAAEKWFPNSQEIYHWSAQDCMTLDKIPYIGQYSKENPDWYVATGFQKWGMTTAMVAALILRDLICGQEVFYKDVFSPSRFSLGNIPALLAETGHSIKGLGKRVLFISGKEAEDILPGQAEVVLYKGKKAGVYKNIEGKIYAVDIRCPHLGCQLEWNAAELSWDCPCHGSRFDYRGNLLNNPAQKNI